MMKLFICLFLLATIMFNNDNPDSYLKSLKLNKDEFLVVIFFESMHCSKCIEKPMELFDSILLNFPQENFKILGFFECEREIELKVFKRKNKINFELKKYDQEVKKKLKIDNGSTIVIYNPELTMKCSLKDDLNSNNLKIVSRFIKKSREKFK